VVISETKAQLIIKQILSYLSAVPYRAM